ncbi:Transcriptional regulator, XRE family [Nostocoides japonicum T1-X7]|uniref:Transcriptional regulator, XRE family n=1 Tax=Nostocoides japonicum T1-X7 TaxID=1194083 RepID=A0A077LSY0_9MICO|nr:helix-turn-helix transcriptional regulator [Tetrasphaera japonica]CCH76363.1 Transcriptional regulator, XRE family [Tetrasphaera japonica T1-X7]
MAPEHEEALADLGRYIRAQREIAQLSLRHLARMTNVSDSYLSQVERGLYQPSPEILRAIAEGLGLSPDVLYRRMGWLSDDGEAAEVSVTDAIRADKRLNQAQKSALIQMYRTMADGS